VTVALHVSLNRVAHGNHLGQFIWIAVAIAGILPAAASGSSLLAVGHESHVTQQQDARRQQSMFKDTLAVNFPSTGARTTGKREAVNLTLGIY